VRARGSILVSLAICALAAGASLPAANATTGAAASDTATSTGTVQILAVDDPAHPHTVAIAELGNGRVVLPPDQAADLHPGDRVSVTTVPSAGGPVVSSVQRIASGPDQLAAGLAGSVAVPPTGQHTLTVLPVFFTSKDAATKESLSTLAAATASYWSAQSGGGISISTSVRDWVQIADPGGCEYLRMADLALAANKMTKPTSLHDHVMIYFPARSACAWAGMGSVVGSMIWDNGLPLSDVTSHEFGHNLGLGHANLAACTNGGVRVTLSSACTVSEYRDYADVMGAAMRAATGNLNSAMADWLGLAKVTTLARGSLATVDLAPLGQVTSATPRAAKIQVSGGWVYLDYRPAVAPDLRMTNWAGVQVHYLPDAGTPASELLDAQPRSASAFSATSLPIGVPWTVPDSGLTVTVLSLGATARLNVAPVGTDTGVPVPTITAPATGALVGSATTVSWKLPSAVAGIRVLLDGVQRLSLTTTALTGSVQLTGMSTGSHQVGVQAVDATGRAGTPSTGLPITVDASPPTTPTGLTLTPISVSAGERLGWRASTDVGPAGLAGYKVTLDGGAPTRVGVVTTTVMKTPTGRHTYWVAAVDNLGNVSPAAGLIVTKTLTASTARGTSRGVVVRLATSTATGTGTSRSIITGRTVGAAWRAV
jgi:hypothetical protein